MAEITFMEMLSLDIATILNEPKLSNCFKFSPNVFSVCVPSTDEDLFEMTVSKVICGKKRANLIVEVAQRITPK